MTPAPSTPTLTAAPGIWVIDPDHTTIGFSVRHAGVANVRGHFTDFDAELRLDAGGALSGSATVRLASVWTGVEQRDDHLRSPDFFDCDRHPEMRFTSTRVDRSDPDELVVAGELRIRGVTREVTLRAELLGPGVDDEGQTRLGLSLTGALSRAAFGMRFNHALGGGNVLVGDRVRLVVELSAVLRG
jgi:polyisoprenoid-binding protein YceI